jgi:tRNA(Ile)-lysidine synthase
MTLAARALATIRRHRMLPRGGRVVVALSGGPDSVALVHLLRELDAAGELVLAGLAHFNHQLRGAAAEADEAFCRSLAREQSLPIDVERADVRETAREEGRSIEDAARRLRYQFLEGARERQSAEAVAIGHSLDDQAETFLLRILRGAGTRGLGSIRPRAGRMIRPLIDIRRDELRQYALEKGLTFQEDATNLDVTIPRNRVRHELLPYLAREFSPRIAEVLAREAALAQDDDERLQAEAIELTASIVLSDTGSTVGLDARALETLHPALASRVARLALEKRANGRFVGYHHVSRFLEFVREATAGQAMSLPGQQAMHQGATVILGPEPPRGVEQVTNFSSVPLSVPGEVIAGGWQLVANLTDPDGPMSDPGGPLADLAVLVTGVQGLSVRFRHPGDRFDPPGMGGRSKKLQDYLVDRKVERAERDRLPLVVDAQDRIVWVVGHGVAEGVRAAGPSPGVILLKARRLGGEG